MLGGGRYMGDVEGYQALTSTMGTSFWILFRWIWVLDEKDGQPWQVMVIIQKARFDRM